MGSKVKKNSFIELLRFLFCLIIVVHHSGFFANGERFIFDFGGLYAVEFFFILTGAFAMKHLSKGAPKDGCMKYSMDYTLAKLKRVFPYASVGIVLSYVWYFVQTDVSLSLKDKIFGRWNIIFELLFMPMTGVMSVDLNSYLNTPLWYLSVVLIVLPLVMFLAIKYKDVFSYYICMIMPFVLHGYLLQRYGEIGNWGNYTGIVFSGVIRGMADIMLGCLVYRLSTLINLNANLKKGLYTIVELICYLFAIYTFKSKVDGYAYEAAVIILAIGMIVTLSGQSYTSIIDGKLIKHLGALSLPIYCIHWPVYRFMTYFNPLLKLEYAVAIAIIVCILLSEVIMLIVNMFNKDKQKGQCVN